MGNGILSTIKKIIMENSKNLSHKSQAPRTKSQEIQHRLLLGIWNLRLGSWNFKNVLIFFFFFPSLIFAILLNSCSTSEKLSDRSGVVLWGENCSRCHAVPDPSAYSDLKWETVGMHMRIRANLTHYEETKIIEFLKTANGE